MKKDFLLFSFLIFLIIFLYILSWFMLDKKLYTLMDEGYYYLTIWKSKFYDQNIGVSQWPYFISKIFSDKIISNIYYLRSIRLFLRIFVLIIFFFFNIYYFGKQYNNKNYIVLFLMVFIVGYFNIGDIIIDFNYIQEFFLLIMLIASLIITKISEKYLLLIIIGFFSFLSLIIIPPSGISITASILFFYIITQKYKLKLFVKSILFFLLGFILSIITVNFIIKDITELFNNIILGTTDIMNSNRGYSLKDHLMKLMIYSRDYFINIVLLYLIYYFAQKISLKINILFEIIFISGVSLLLVVLKKPVLNVSTLISFPIFIYLLNEYILSYKNNNLNRKDLIIDFFIFLFPIISTVGTNTNYAVKMIYFILPWIILLFKIWINDKSENNYSINKRLIIIVLIIPIFLTLKNNYDLTQYKYKFKFKGPTEDIYLNKSQYNYFNTVNNILINYNYKPKVSKIFAFTFDHMTIATFMGIPIETFQNAMEFSKYKNKECLPIPDFIFLTKFDIEYIDDEIYKLNWNFPNGYDKYFVGTPDPNSIWDSQRYLYCRKIKSN